MKFILKNGQVASGDRVFDADVIIENGTIVEVVEGGAAGPDIQNEIDVKGKVILPGLIDVHVHFREPGADFKEDWVTGSQAAASGGVTTVFDMPNNDPAIVTLKDLAAKKKLIGKRSYVNYGLYMGYDGKNVGEINKAEGIAGVKVYCAHSTGDMGISDMHLEQAFAEIDRKHLLLFHAEDENCIEGNRKEMMSRYEEGIVPSSVHSEIRSVECAVMMVKKVCELAKKYDRTIHICHVSTEEELDLIDQYGDLVTCEVAPHHLVLSDDDYDFLGNFVRVNPPLRSRVEVFGLWKSLKTGMVDILATDHAPHLKIEKEQPYLSQKSHDISDIPPHY